VGLVASDNFWRVNSNINKMKGKQVMKQLSLFKYVSPISRISISSYGRYSSSNYGVSTMIIDLGCIKLYFSYRTVIAFRTVDTGLVVMKNYWNCTTGKHINWVDGGSKEARKQRLTADEFEDKLSKVFKSFDMDVSLKDITNSM